MTNAWQLLALKPSEPRMNEDAIRDYIATAEKCINPNLMGAISCYDFIGDRLGLEKALEIAENQRNISAIGAAEDALNKMEDYRRDTIIKAEMSLKKGDIKEAYKLFSRARDVTGLVKLQHMISINGYANNAEISEVSSLIDTKLNYFVNQPILGGAS
jgi:hypothetical protein